MLEDLVVVVDHVLEGRRLHIRVALRHTARRQKVNLINCLKMDVIV